MEGWLTRRSLAPSIPDWWYDSHPPLQQAYFSQQMREHVHAESLTQQVICLLSAPHVQARSSSGTLTL